MKLSKSKLSKLHNKKAQTRKQRLVKKKQKERQRGGKKPKSILKTKRKYSRPFNLRYKTLRNVQKRKRDRKHNKPRKIRFLLKGGQEDQTTKTGIELTPIKKIELTPIKKEEEKKEEQQKQKDLGVQEKKRDTSDSLSMSTPLLSSSQETSQETSKKIVSDTLERMNKFQPPQINNISQRTPEQEEKVRKLREVQDSIPPQPDDETKDEEPVKAPEKAPSTEPVRTTMSTDENDDYKIITVKVYYPKKALTNVISDSGNSTAQTLNVLTSNK